MNRACEEVLGSCEALDGIPVAGRTDWIILHDALSRLTDATGPWGQLSWLYDGVGNRTQEVSTPPGGAAATDAYAYPAASHRLAAITRAGSTLRSFAHDAAGNIVADTRLGSTYAYTPAFAGAGSTTPPTG